MYTIYIYIALNEKVYVITMQSRPNYTNARKGIKYSRFLVVHSKLHPLLNTGN